jgi:hypothetical protein
MPAEHAFPLRSGRTVLAVKNTIDLNCRISSKYNASHWSFAQKRPNPRTMRNNAAIIALAASGCTNGADLPALGA